MADTINIGNYEVSCFKVGSGDCKIYLGDTLLYPKTPSYKLILTYNDSTEYKIECDGTTALTASEVSGGSKPSSAITSAVVNACGQSSFRIDTNAFYGCSAMTAITLDDNITEFGSQAFFGCSGLTSFSFPSGLTTIESGCFRLANNIKRIEGIPSGVTYLGSGCFADMAALSSATIPSSVTELRTSVFLRDAALKTVHFQRTTAPTILADCFKSTGIQKIYIPTCNSYDSYAAQPGLSAFTNYIYAENDTQCHRPTYQFAFKREHLSGSTTSAYTRACASSPVSLTYSMARSGTTFRVISGNSNPVTAITVGDCTSGVSYQAFSGWTKASKIIIGDSVKSIGASAFCFCASASTVTNSTLDLGLGLTLISNRAFFGCVRLGGEVKIPNTCTAAGNYTFCNCEKITGITIGNGLTSIGEGLFKNCTGATKLSIGTNVTTINKNAFDGCKSITAITIPNSVQDIFLSAFTTCIAAKTLTIGNSVREIGQGCFQNCSGLTSITINATTPPTLGNDAFNGSTCPIYVPSASVNAYKSASGWSTYASRIQAIT